MSKVLAILVAAFVLGNTLVDTEAALERTGDHHEHSNMLDAPADGSHQHGDKDDHHDSPNSPCDHHVLHCCCGHVHVLSAPSVPSDQSTEDSLALKAIALTPRFELSVDRILHVPIA